MTMNNLPYPFTEDTADATDEDKERKKYDKGAFNARMKRINLEESFTLADKFPISVIEFAHILLYMYEKFDAVKKPDVSVKKIVLDRHLKPNAFE